MGTIDTKAVMMENDERFEHLDLLTADLACSLTKTKIPLTVNEEGDVNMCQAIKDIREEGREAGIIEGRMESRIRLIVCKVQKNKSLSEIADALEEDEDALKPVYNIVLANAPEYNIDKICAELKNKA